MRKKSFWPSGGSKWLLLVLLFAGTLTQGLTMIRSGLIYDFGMGFWGPNGHDGVWHLALISQIAQGKLAHPTFAGQTLTNYHIGFDLLVALVNRITGISIVSLYFQILPLIFSLLLGILTYLLVAKWTNSKSSAMLSTFFVYFGGSWGWLVSYLRNKSLGGESMFWANQSISFLLNPPYALSVIFLLLGLYFFLDYLVEPTRKLWLVLSLIFGVLIQIKVYAGVTVLGSLGILGILRVIRESDRSVLRLFLGSLLVALLVFLPFNYKAGSLLVFSPFWFPRTMLSFQDRLGWIRLENARQAYLATHQYLRWILAEGLALAIFIAGNLGTRIIGVGYLVSLGKRVKKACLPALLPAGQAGGVKKDKKVFFEVFLLFILSLSLALPLAFTQRGNPWNTIQFFYYFQLVLGIMAGVYLARMISLIPARFLKVVGLGIVLILTLPTSLGTLALHYLPPRPPAKISLDELEALNFLKHQPKGTVLTYPYDPELKEKIIEPKPLYIYETTAYVSAFSGKQVFLEDEMNLEIMGLNWRPRRGQSASFFGAGNPSWARKFLEDNQIGYLYLVKDQKINLGEDDLGVRRIFDNGEVRIWEID